MTLSHHEPAPGRITVEVCGRAYDLPTFEDASRLFCAARDRFGEGASKTPTPRVKVDGAAFGWISYNGRVWRGDPMSRDGGALVFDPCGGAR